MHSNLTSILRQNKLLSPDQEHKAQLLSETENISIITALINLNIFTYRELASKISQLFNMPMAEIADHDYVHVCQKLGLRELITTHHALPLAINDQRLILAVADPTQQQTENDFRFATGLQTEIHIAEYKTLSASIRRLYGSENIHDQANSYKDLSQDELSDMADSSAGEIQESSALFEDDSPVSRFIHQVIMDAVRKNASDIHFEPYEKDYRIRFRCDGLLVETHKPAPQLASRLASRIKILSGLDIAEKRLPQDGRIKLRLNESKDIDLRVSTLPTLWGEKIVLRLLNNSVVKLDIDKLGFSDPQIEYYLNALNRPQGMILVTGPTGSGKTVSLYTGLHLINTARRNISAAEDPVEINLPGINQVQINIKTGFGFAQALRAFLRQDPDVVMVGEIRDTETAEIAVRAAQTGHLVLSTLHTNSAAEAVIRLRNMGIETFNLTSSLSLIIAQRLARKLCPHCKQTDPLNEALRHKLSIDQITEVYRSGKGCTECTSGYLGRIAIYEVMAFDSYLSAQIANGCNVSELESEARNRGMKTLKESGVELLKAGVTSYAELQRVLYF